MKIKIDIELYFNLVNEVANLIASYNDRQRNETPNIEILNLLKKHNRLAIEEVQKGGLTYEDNAEHKMPTLPM